MDFVMKTDMGKIIFSVSKERDAVICKEIANKLIEKKKEENQND